MTETTNPKTRTLGVIDAVKAKKIAGLADYTITYRIFRTFRSDGFFVN